MRAYVLGLLLICFSVPGIGAADLPAAADEHTILLLTFDEDGDAALDSSGREVPLRTVRGTKVPGRFGSALRFGQEGGFVEFPGSVFPADGDFTLEMWFRLQSRVLLCWAGYSPGLRLTSYGGGGVRFGFDDGEKQIFEDIPYAFDDNYWHKLALVVRARSGATLYIDGVRVSSLGLGGLQYPIRFPEKAYFGGWPRWSETRGEWMTGAIDEVRVWDVARELEELFPEERE